MSNEIKSNFVFLAKSLTNLPEILAYLYQYDVISLNEAEEIQAAQTNFLRNTNLLNLMQRKCWEKQRDKFLDILRNTKNGHCADEVEEKACQPGNNIPMKNPKTNPENPKQYTVDDNVKQVNQKPSQGTSNIQLMDFDSFEIISSGSFGLVMKARHRESQLTSAIKITHKYFYREVDCLRRSGHPNIVGFMNSWSEHASEHVMKLHRQFQKYDQMFCVQMELCNGNDLKAWIIKRPSEKLEWDAKRIFWQISLGVESLHAKDIIHRDLKPANILLMNEYTKGQQDLVVKIGDLGMSRATYQESKMSKRSFMTNCGTPFYMSPEQESERYGYMADIFPMGIILFELLNSTSEKTEVTLSIRHGKLPKNFTEKFVGETKLIKQMLAEDPCNRLSAEEVVDHLNDLWTIDPCRLKKTNSKPEGIDVNQNVLQDDGPSRDLLVDSISPDNPQQGRSDYVVTDQGGFESLGSSQLATIVNNDIKSATTNQPPIFMALDRYSTSYNIGNSNDSINAHKSVTHSQHASENLSPSQPSILPEVSQQEKVMTMINSEILDLHLRETELKEKNVRENFHLQQSIRSEASQPKKEFDVAIKSATPDLHTRGIEPRNMDQVNRNGLITDAADRWSERELRGKY